MSDEPMVWAVPKCPPASVFVVRDAHGDIWRRDDDRRCWRNGSALLFWETLLHAHGPLTEEKQDGHDRPG